MIHLKRLFFWLSGAGTETLERCPAWEQRKYVAFGATVLVPCAFGFIACSYAISTVTDNPRIIFPVATVWAFIILTIDRALLAGYRPYLSFFRKVSQFSLRIVVAILMGVTIAHPLVLMLFRDTINTVIERERAGEIEETRIAFAGTKEEISRRATTLETVIAGQRDEWNESFQARFLVQDGSGDASAIPGLDEAQQAQLRAAIDEAVAPFADRLETIDARFAEHNARFSTLQTELGFWQTEFERELDGQRSGIPGEGPRARSIRADQLEPRREEASRLTTLLEHLASEKTTLESLVRQAEAAAIADFDAQLADIARASREEAERVAGLRRMVEQDQAGQFVTQQNALRETIRQQIDTRLEELRDVRQELSTVIEEENLRVAALRAEPRRDILTQTLALHGLFRTGGEGGRFALNTYLILILLFMLVDTIPLIVKFFTKSGPYDTLVDRDEIRFDAEHRAFLTSHSRYMERLAESNLIAVTRNPRLEHALVDGVEHTRAASEFLDAIIDMEKSFAAKMRAEEQDVGVADSDKRAALEAIKKRFYADMHHRMESFFTPASPQPGT